MSTLIVKQTNKKFYGKWLYKVSLRVPGAGYFRIHPLDRVSTEIVSDKAPTNGYVSHFSAILKENRYDIAKLADFLVANSNREWNKRIERSTMDFYTNDVEFYNNLANTFADAVIHKFEPSSNNIDILKDSSTIVVNKLPHNLYQYRVYLLPHKQANDKEGKKKFVDWLVSQNPKITCTTSLGEWFIATDWNWDRRYVLVDSEQTLLMLKLRNSAVVGRIYKFIVSDK